MNASDIIADRLITRGIYLERYKAGFNNRILAELEKLEDGLSRELVSLFSKGVPNPTMRVQRLEKLLGETRHVIRRSYAEKKSLSGKELTRLAANEQAYVVAAINDTAGIEIADRVLNFDELKKLTDDTLIHGAKSAEWWDRQGDDLQKRFSDQMRQGVLRGETLDQLTARVRGSQAKAFTDGVMPATKRQAEALVRTSVQAVANATRDEFYRANSDIVNAIQWVSTLDSRTTHICMALSGKLWTTETHNPVGHSLPYPGPTAHWNCRSTQVAVIKSWEELVKGQDEAELDDEFKKQLRAQGFDEAAIAQIKRNTRASMDGQVAKDLTFDAWLKSKPPEFQDRMLGKGKGRLFRDGKITLTDLVDQRLRPLTIDDLESLPQPRPGPKPVKLPSRRKKPPAPPPAPARAPGEFPPIDEIEDVKKLGGSTGAVLVKDTKTGTRYVKKSGNSPDHIREEFAADQAYRAAGIDVPKAVLYDSPAGPVKLAEFIDGKNLGDYLASASPAEVDQVLAKIRKGFVTDAVFANHDVAGLSMDNIIVDAKGVPWRIDNGGSLRFRAQGAPKSSAVWNGSVAEIDSLRDSAINPQTARIFAGLSDGEVEEQIRDLLTRETAILDAVPEAARAVLQDRFRTLRARLDTLITEDVALRVREAKVKGIALPSDRDEFEDVQFLAWEEIGEDGNPLTAAKIKLTTRGAEKVMEAIKDSVPKKSKVAVAKALPEDSFWAQIEPGVKTVNTHAGDGHYNVAKVATMRLAKAELDALATPTAALAEMKAHYLDIIAKAEAAMQTKSKTELFAQFTVKPPVKTPKASPAAPKFKVKEESLTWPIKAYASGQPTRTAGKVTVKGSTLAQDGYVIELGPVQVRFIPYRSASAKGSLGKTNAQALMGTLEVEVAGAATRENISRAVEALKQLGLSPTKATDEYLEAVWLRKTLAMRTDRVDNATRDRIREIMDLEGTPDAERVRQLRAIAVDKLGIEPPRDPALWRPRASSDGRGWAVSDRWDMPAAKVERELKGYAVTHHTAASIPELLENLLRQGGELTSTVERARKGIAIETGMSPNADLVKGGATHIYTRIKQRANAYRESGFVFKVRTLARQDAFSFQSDWYGGVDNFFNTEMIYASRAKTATELKAFAASSGNETLFKWNLSLLDELEAIVVSTPAEKAATLRKFAAAGITTLPDGRNVAQMVRTTKDPLP